MSKLLSCCLFLLALIGCSEQTSQQKAVDDKERDHPAMSSFENATAPKKIASKPCSNYNLKFYEGDTRTFDQSLIRLGDAKSNATVVVNERSISILGFVGQAEEYVNYSIYRGTQYTSEQDATGATLTTEIETQITVCFRKKAIAVKQLIENVRARGDLTKTQNLTKQWLWKVEE